ncbi:hypothetical protein AGOR_G00200430 [Albula goreensis]|uniref:Uncharacterized protein n=1 Tax=Albula goreensis TaxID=1534307 RepID=A0A8T3CP12_9TELE|nr:hypothetical protein AGOR_G00200430 [Albula goreensis]
MASNQDKLLKDRLLQLECHFTWGLKKSDTDLNDLQNRLENCSELAVKEDRSIGWSFSILAFTKYLQGLLEEARDNLEKAEEHIRKHHGDNCEEQLIVTYGNFAWVYYHMDNYKQSQTYMDKLDEVKKRHPPESPSALHPAIYGEKGITLLRFSGKYYEEATECFKKALEVEPEDINWNAGYAFSLYRIESELTSIEESPAIKQLRRTLELDPDNAQIMVLLGLKYAVYKKFQKAEELVERALELEPENPYVTRYVAKFFRNQRMVKVLGFWALFIK